MPRQRQIPPTALRLVTGPTPPRNTPKHTLPSVPRPTFQLPSIVARGPAPRHKPSISDQHHGAGSAEFVFASYSDSSSSSSPTSSSGSYSPRSRSGSITSPPIRGPWDHSGCIVVPIDVESMLTPLKPVAVSPI